VEARGRQSTFSEVVQRAQSKGPQRVTVRGKDTAVVISAVELERLLPQERKSPFVEFMESLYDNDHAAAAARTWRRMIGRGAGISGVVHCRRINLRHWSGDQLPGARDVGLAAGAGQHPQWRMR